MATSGQPTILVVEDDQGLRSLIVTILGGAGYRVLEAAEGVRAVRLAAEQRPDAVVLDVRLGADDGVSLARQLHLDDPGLAIALMSGDSSAEEIRRGFAPAHVLEKPFTADQLVATVENLLRA